MSDVYEEIIKLYDQAEAKGFNIGEALYSQCAFFCDYSKLLDSKIQTRIKEFNYCKAFSCPPYPSLQETPANMLDEFMIIEQEYNLCLEQSKGKE